MEKEKHASEQAVIQKNNPLKFKNGEIGGLIEDLAHLVTEKLKLKIKGEAYLLVQKLSPFLDAYKVAKSDFEKKYGQTFNTLEEYSKLSKEAQKEWEEYNEKEHEVISDLKAEMIEHIESSYPYSFLMRILKR